MKLTMRESLILLTTLTCLFSITFSQKITFTLGKRQVKCFKDEFPEGAVSALSTFFKISTISNVDNLNSFRQWICS